MSNDNEKQDKPKSKRPPAQPTEATLKKRRLRQEILVSEYLREFNVEDAARASGYSRLHTSRLLEKPEVQALIELKQAEIRKALSRSDADVIKLLKERLNEFVDIDPSDIASVYKGCCRCCWGTDENGALNYAKQYNTESSLFDAQERHKQKYASKKKPPVFKHGGFGYTKTLAPNPRCLKCSGLGISRMQLNATRGNKSKRAVAQITEKNGVAQVEFINASTQAKYVELAMRHFGMFNTDTSSGIQITNMLTEQVKQALIPSEDEIQQQISELDT